MQSCAEAITFQASPDFVNRSFFLGAGDLHNILTQVNHFSPKLTTLFLQTALANKSQIIQIFPYSKFEINLSTG